MSKEKLKVVCVLYADPVDGYPPKYARDDIPKLARYPDGQTMPSPEAIDFKPGELLGCVSGELGLRKFSSRSRPGPHRAIYLNGMPLSIAEMGGVATVFLPPFEKSQISCR